jgi:hypothetical protein
MPATPLAVLSLYGAAFLSFIGAVNLRHDEPLPLYDALARGLERGELEPGVPRLDPEDAMANAALLRWALAQVGTPGLDERDCTAAPRSFSVMLDGKLSKVRFGARAVCQLRRLKRISVAQQGFGHRGLGEVAAYILGRRMRGTADVDVTRIIIPPFRFSRDTVTLPDTDLGGLLAGERFIGTYHTHPEGDIEQGVPSTTDLRFMRYGFVDFHGQVGYLWGGNPDVEWLFDIVEPRDGDWNVYSHDAARMESLRQECRRSADCPLDELRVVGSRYYLFTRYFDETPPW